MTATGEQTTGLPSRTEDFPAPANERSQSGASMDISMLHALLEFVKPYHAQRDELHGLGHVQRVLEGARRLASGESVDDDLLVFGAHLHGLVYNEEAAIRAFLSALGMGRERVNAVMRVALESCTESVPQTREGGFLHDAHLIEGGKEFQMAKSLLAGAARGQSLSQTVDFVLTRVLGRFSCTTDEGRTAFSAIEAFRKEFFEQIQKALKDGKSSMGRRGRGAGFAAKGQAKPSKDDSNEHSD